MWLSNICKYKCSNAKVPPWRFLMKTSPFTAVMGLKHEITKLRMMWTHFMGRKKWGDINCFQSICFYLMYDTDQSGSLFCVQWFEVEFGWNREIKWKRSLWLVSTKRSNSMLLLWHDFVLIFNFMGVALYIQIVNFILVSSKL
jgi:hypothetical protein